ncbi:glycosyltransferase family protein [Flavobacterium sp. I-SCBP12n]|uniref:Glycosyltransferase family protein n=1 Tax=Flavobacterium pygoscelis TaxID=2893176 RepID=A0A9X2BKX4_9FLAO|nr:glycosyltransferase family protein [Flavobacterium pygoscelis]MCK8141472.1 glycosyltransferase family protein [Flavobacterium pygoscelis]
MESINTLLITQARTGSTRLPGKILLKVQGNELLKIHLDRLSLCKNVDKILVATTTNIEDSILISLCENWGFATARGSESDVLDRFYQAAKEFKPQWIIRVTSDCPLLDPKMVDAVIACAQLNDVDYCSNGLIENFPDGQDVEVFKFSALELAWKEAKLKSEREHVTPFIRVNSNFNGGNLFNSINFPCAYDFSEIRMTVDEPKDFDLINKLITDLGTGQSWLGYTNYIIDNNLNSINGNIIRNEGLVKSLKND